MEIDVSKCRYYCEKYDGCYCFNSSKEIYAINPNEHNSCETNNDCYYKQLQQLKAENEGLQSLNDFNVQKIETLEAENEELRMLNKANADNYVKWRNKIEAENEELKEKLEQADEDIKAECTRCALTNKLEQCLDEIEEHIKTCNNTMHCKDCKFSENCQYRNGWVGEKLFIKKSSK